MILLRIRSTASSAGFTLIELMIVVAIVAVLLLVVAPDFGRFVADSRVTTTKDKLMAAISLARTEAIKRGEPVVVCRANVAGNDCANNGTDWSDGWLVFADLDDDGNLDGGIAGNEIVRVQTDIDDLVTVNYSLNNPIIYNGRGILETGAAGDQTFIIGDAADNSIETGLFVRSTGRTRSCADWNSGTHQCDD